MGRANQAARQRGVALFLSLIMLLVLTVLGISSFHNSHIQERSAGNARLQSVAFEAAAAGATNAINFFNDHADMAPDELCGSLGHDGWENPTEWVDMGTVGEASLKQRMYCLADEYPDDEGGRPARSQLFVLSRGEVISGGQVVALRDIEVRLDRGATGAPGDGCGALCFPSCNPGTMNFPNSNSFQVDGDGGYAITGGCDDMTDAIDDAVTDNRIGNYIGGLGTTGPGSPWDTPANVEYFRQEIMTAAQEAHATPGICQTGCYYPGDHADNSNSAYGSVGDEQITYIHGDASFGGNISGAGIMFVNGNLSWAGTPNFQGLIVTLGGTFTITGGGHGGDHGGSVVILNQPDDPLAMGAEFEPSGFENEGGGEALYQYDCGALQSAQNLLDDDGQGMWSPECSDAGSIWAESPTETIIASWRENIGWREEFFGSED